MKIRKLFVVALMAVCSGVAYGQADPFTCNDPIEFGDVTVGVTSTMVETCENTGSSPATVNSISFDSVGSAGFGLSGLPTLPLVVPPGGMMTFTVRYTPSVTGMVETVLNIDTTSSGTPFLVEVDVLGAGVLPTATTTAVVSSMNPSSAGQSVTLTATVTGSNATGTVQFMDGAANLGAPVALSGGTAALTTSALAVGTHPITAVYSGDANNGGSTSPVLNQVVNSAGPVSLTSSVNPSLVGQSVTFTATVTGTNPTGTVQFKDDATNLGGPVALAGGTATFATSSLTAGVHAITAVYSGDANNPGNTSPALNQLVNSVAPPPPTNQPIPTLSEWAMVLLIGLIGLLAMRSLRSRRPR